MQTSFQIPVETNTFQLPFVNKPCWHVCMDQTTGNHYAYLTALFIAQS